MRKGLWGHQRLGSQQISSLPLFLWGRLWRNKVSWDVYKQREMGKRTGNHSNKQINGTSLHYCDMKQQANTNWILHRHHLSESIHTHNDNLGGLTWGFELLELVVNEREMEDDGAELISRMLEDVTFPHLLTFILLHLESKRRVKLTATSQTHNGSSRERCLSSIDF